MGDESYRTYVRPVKAHCKSTAIPVYRKQDGVSMKTRTAWLNRLGGSPPFFPLDDQRDVRPAWSMGGLAAGAVPAVVRSSHGYIPQLPTDSPEPLKEARFGDFFRS
jgi:hypothetical protein